MGHDCSLHRAKMIDPLCTTSSKYVRNSITIKQASCQTYNNYIVLKVISDNGKQEEQKKSLQESLVCFLQKEKETVRLLPHNQLYSCQ